MGEAYRARDAKLNRDVALKILPDTFASDVERLGRFRREAQVLAAINHPNIAHIYGFDDPDGRLVGLVPSGQNPTTPQASQQIHVVVNWLEELKQRAAPPH